MKLQDCHSAYIPTRDEIGTFAVDPVRPTTAGAFVSRTDEILLAASSWVLRTATSKVVKDLPPMWRFLHKVLRIKKATGATRRITFHDGTTIEFTVRVVEGGAK